jgi:hypothetical protein
VPHKCLLGAARESPRLTDAVAGQGGDLVGVLLVDDHPERGRSRRVGAARHRRGEDGRKAESRRTCNQGKGENGPARRERHGRQRQRAARAAQADASRVAPIAPPGSRRRASDARGSAPRGYRPHCRRRAARDHGATAIAAHAAVAAPDEERCALRAMRPQARPPCAPTPHWWALVEAPWRNRPAAARRTRCFACAPGSRAWALHLRIFRKRPRAEKRRSRIVDLETIFSKAVQTGQNLEGFGIRGGYSHEPSFLRSARNRSSKSAHIGRACTRPGAGRNDARQHAVRSPSRVPRVTAAAAARSAARRPPPAPRLRQPETPQHRPRPVTSAAAADGGRCSLHAQGRGGGPGVRRGAGSARMAAHGGGLRGAVPGAGRGGCVVSPPRCAAPPRACAAARIATGPRARECAACLR